MLARYNVLSCCGDKKASVVIPVSADFDETDDNAERADAIRRAGYDPGARCGGCYDTAYHAEFVGRVENRQVRQNVRNFLVPMTVAEVQSVRDSLLERGDDVGAGYAEEFLRELEADFAGCETPDL